MKIELKFREIDRLCTAMSLAIGYLRGIEQDFAQYTVKELLEAREILYKRIEHLS